MTWLAIAALALASCYAPPDPTAVTLGTVNPVVEPTPTLPPTPSPTSRPTFTPTPTLTLILAAPRTPEAPVDPPRSTTTPKPTETPRPTPTPKPTETPRPTATPRPTETPRPTATPDLYSTLAFAPFTHLPIDFAPALDAFLGCSVYSGLTPFVYSFHVNHTEGPRKWYLGTCRGEIVKVYMPTRGLLRFIRDGSTPGSFNGDKILINADVSFEVGSEVNVRFSHIALLDEVRVRLEASPNSEVIFEAGAHIGYMYTPDLDWEGLGFAVSDRNADSGLTENPDHWWNRRVNPLDYFTEENQRLILDAYQGTYDMLVAQGTIPYSNLEDSRGNFNKQDQIWSIWFKDDLDDAFGADQGSAWAVISFLNKADFNQETYWRTLEQYPSMSGLFVEKGRSKDHLVGNPLYEGDPLERTSSTCFRGMPPQESHASSSTSRRRTVST